MNAVFYDGPNFPDKKTFERTAYQEAVLLSNGEILGFREGVVYRFFKGLETKFIKCFHKRKVRFRQDSFGNIFFLENSSKITKAFKVYAFDKPKTQAFYSLEKILDFYVISMKPKSSMLFIINCINVLEIFEEHKLNLSYNPHIIDGEKVLSVTAHCTNERFDSFLVCLNIKTALSNSVLKIFKYLPFKPQKKLQ